MSEAQPTDGPSVRRALFGPGSDAVFAAGAAGQLAPEFNQIVDDSVFGRVWTDERLELPYRSLVTIAALTVLGREAQLRTHVAAGLRVGLTRDQIVGAVTHLAFYAGLPAAYSALETVRQVFADVDATTDEAPQP
jgi:4-carboxymuconolactone decarboxylase